MADGSELLEMKKITLLDSKGNPKEYILSHIPAWNAQRIMQSLPVNIIMNLIPKFANEEVLNKIKLELMSYIAVDVNDGCLTRLTTEALINNHVYDWELLTKLQSEMLQYNASFLQDGRILNFLVECAQIHIPKIIKTLMASLEQ